MVKVTQCVAGEQYTEIIPATKTSANNGIRWTPSERPNEGEIIIDMGRTRAVYHLTEMQTAWEGRAFRLDIVRGGTDPESESYNVFAAANPQDRQCDCKGFSYGRGRPCKHIAAVEALLENQWI